MNEYIEKYIERRKKEIEEEKKERINQIAQKEKIGKHDEVTDNYLIGDVTDEEWEELQKYLPKDDKISGWYYLGIILICVCVIISFWLLSEDQVIAGISLTLGSLLTSSTIILLSKIELNTRKEK